LIKKNIINYDKYHNHNISEINAPKAKIKFDIKNKIINNDNHFNMKGHNIYKKTTKNSGIIIPDNKSVRSLINREINKNFPKEIKSWEDIPDKDDFYQTI